MGDIFGLASWHVAVDAIATGFVLCLCVAGGADLLGLCHRFGAAHLPVDVVAGCAAQLLRAGTITGRLPQPVGRTDDLELLSLARVGGMVQVLLVVTEGFAGAVRKHVSARAQSRSWQVSAGRRQVALQANFEGAFRREAGRIHDGRSLRIFHVLIAVAVTSLTIDTFAQLILLGVGVVAEQTASIHFAGKALVTCPVITGAHLPIAPATGIPTDWQFQQRVLWCPVQIGARVVPGAEDVIHGHLEGLEAAGALLA